MPKVGYTVYEYIVAITGWWSIFWVLCGGRYTLASDGLWWVMVGVGGWWWIYFGWWWMVVGCGGYILAGGGWWWMVMGRGGQWYILF